MVTSRKSLAFHLLAPLLTLGLVGGIFCENRNHMKPEDAERYHARAAHAILKELPHRIDSWVGTDQANIQEAVTLLRPNALITRRYLDTATPRSATLLIVQTRDIRDMLGHFPPVCYVTQGETEVFRERRTWQTQHRAIDGFEYHYEQLVAGQRNRKAVYNFMIAPQAGILPDMSSLGVAERNHVLRHFGAAQVQLLMPADWSREQRDEIFTAFMTALEPIIRTIIEVDGEEK